MAYFEQTVANLLKAAANARELAANMQSTSLPGGGTKIGGSGASTAAVTPHAVAAALAEAVKSDDATTQQIAIRLSDIASKYPDRAA